MVVKGDRETSVLVGNNLVALLLWPRLSNTFRTQFVF